MDKRGPKTRQTGDVLAVKRNKNAPARYEIRVAGHLSANWAARFEGVSIRLETEGETVLSGSLDQAGLHGILVRVRDPGLILISVNRVAPAGPGVH
jgi:hypothetical protein